MKSTQGRKKELIVKILVVTAAIVYILAQYDQVPGSGMDKLLALMERISEQPLAIFPLAKATLVKGLGISALVAAYMYSKYDEQKHMRPGEEKGSAGWNDNIKAFHKKYAETRPLLPGKIFKNLCWKVDETPGSKNTILSDELYLSLDGRKTRRNVNQLVIGGSGTGKSRYFIKPNVLQANASMVVTDPSGELIASLGGFLEKQGYKIKVLNLCDMTHSCTYNPFAYIRSDEDVVKMIDVLIKNTNNGKSSSDPFWEKSERALISACCFYLIETAPPEEQNFSNVIKLLQEARLEEGYEDEPSLLDIRFEKLSGDSKDSLACSYYRIFKAAGSGKTAQSIMICAQTRLEPFLLPAVRALTEVDGMDLLSIGREKTALFTITPVNDETFSFLVSLLYTQLLSTLYHYAETECPGFLLPVPVRFLMDEFANIKCIPQFAEILSTCRKYQISITVVLQALSQLKTRYKDDWESIVGNCDELIFLGGTDACTLDYLTKKLGKETIRVKNSSVSKGSKGSFSESYNKDGRDLMTADEISFMSNDMSLVFVRGEKPFKTPKYKLEKHPNYKLTGDFNPEYLYSVRDRVITGSFVGRKFAAEQTKEPVIEPEKSPESSRIEAIIEQAMAEQEPEVMEIVDHCDLPATLTEDRVAIEEIYMPVDPVKLESVGNVLDDAYREL